MHIKEFKLYDNIMILTESGTAEYIGAPLLEDEDPASKKLLLSTLKEKIGIFKGDKEAINNVAARITTMKGKKMKILDWVKFIATKLMLIIGKIFSKIVKFLLMLWEFAKKHIPGVQAIATKVDGLLFKNSQGKARGFKIGEDTIATKDLIGIGGITFVLIGTLGYIAKKIAGNGGSEGGPTGQQESIVISTAPFTLLESDGDVASSFTKQVPGVFSKIIDLIKNISDSASAFFVKTIGMLIIAGLFILLLIISAPIICKMIKYSLGIDAAGVSNILSGMDKAKYISAKLAVGMANILGRTAHMNIFDTCDCIEYNKDSKQYAYKPSGNCPTISRITAEIKEKARKQ